MTLHDMLLVTSLIIQTVTSLPARQLSENGAVDLHAIYKGVFITKFPSQTVNCDDDNAIPFRDCSPREIIDCGHFEELGTPPDKQGTSTTEFRTTIEGTFEVKEHLDVRNYTLQIHSFNEQIWLNVFHSQDSEIYKWTLTLELHSRSGRAIDLPMQNFPELKILFNFNNFLTALTDHSHGYHGDENSFKFNWKRAKLGVHTLRQTYLDCRCIVAGRTEEVPCDTRLESTTTSASSGLPQNVVLIAWVVAAALIILHQYLLRGR